MWTLSYRQTPSPSGMNGAVGGSGSGWIVARCHYCATSERTRGELSHRSASARRLKEGPGLSALGGVAAADPIMTPFPSKVDVRWRRLDLPGREEARIEQTAGGWRLTGQLEIEEA